MKFLCKKWNFCWRNEYALYRFLVRKYPKAIGKQFSYLYKIRHHKFWNRNFVNKCLKQLLFCISRPDLTLNPINDRNGHAEVKENTTDFELQTAQNGTQIFLSSQAELDASEGNSKILTKPTPCNKLLSMAVLELLHPLLHSSTPTGSRVQTFSLQDRCLQRFFSPQQTEHSSVFLLKKG